MRIFAGTSVVFAVTLFVGCAARGPRAAKPHAPAVDGATETAAAGGTLSEYIEKIRHVSVTAKRSGDKNASDTLEARDAELAADLLLLSTAPTAERHRTVAERYRELNVLDAAYRHFNSALAMNPRDAAAYEGLARVWRDWGLPQLALGDAYRAAFFAPASTSARNTLGTIMQALGRYADAKAAYELASWLDPHAAYPINNLCYLAFANGHLHDAIGYCNAALKLDPSLAAARNNLALTFAAAGRMDLARKQFLESGDVASGLYNTGIAYLASGDQRNALAAFDAATRARPTFDIARERAAQIRARLGFAAAAERRDNGMER